MNKEGFFTTKKIALMGLLTAMCAVGALLKVPSPTGTVAFDSFPGFLAAILLGWKEGAVVAALGHMLTALTAGFPLTVPVHLYIAAQMAGYAAVLWWLSDKGNAGSVRMIAAGVLVSLLNGVLAAASIIPFFGKAAFIGLLPSLVVASFANVFLAIIVAKFVQKAQPRLVQASGERE